MFGLNTITIIKHIKLQYKVLVSGQFSYSGCTSSGSRAEASWEKALSGNRAWADVK